MLQLIYTFMLCNKLEGSTSEITATAATTLSTITETKNKPTTQVVIPKQKGIQINVEEGTTSDNAKEITLSTHLDAAVSLSGQLVTSECKTSSQEDGDRQIALTSFSISTTKTNDQGSLNDGGNLDQDNEIEDAIPEETHNEMVEGDHIHIPSSSSSTALSQKELEELKAKDPLEAFKLMLSSRGSSTDKAQGFSTISGNKPSATSKNVLIQELQAKVLNINLFQTIEQDPNITYEIKALLQKLNNPNSGESIVGFILEFEPFLDQVAKDFQKKKDTTTRLDLQGNTRNKEWDLVEESRNKTTALETQGKQSKETVAAYDANISKWQKEIKELQSKIEIEERRKAEIQSTILDSLESQINEEANSGIAHFENATKLEAEIKELVETEALIKTRLKHAKTVFDRMKANLKI